MLKYWIQEVAAQLAAQEAPQIDADWSVLQTPEMLDELLEIIQTLPIDPTEKEQYDCMACWFFFDMCIAQLQMGVEHRHKRAARLLSTIMDQLAALMLTGERPLGFWLPILNAFYEVHVELSPALRDAFMTIASHEDDGMEEQDSVQSIQAMFEDLAGASDFEIAEYFFAQSHAMMPEFFMDLLADLCATDEGQEVSILFLLHPKAAVRSVVLLTLDGLMPSLKLSSQALTRLKMISHWCPDAWAPYLKRWMHAQRRQGVSFLNWPAPKKLKMLATEVDGGGVQGLILQMQQDGMHRLGGLLLKYSVGIKDAWLTQFSSLNGVQQYYEDLCDGQVKLRRVNMAYFQQMVGHFLALIKEKDALPPLRFLELQCLLGETITPQRLEPAVLLQSLGVQIMPFTPEGVAAALKRTAKWIGRHAFMRSWFEEGPEIDTLVNHCCHFKDGVKVCEIAKACMLVMQATFEADRERWLFHFLWTALWAQIGARSTERFWQDVVIVADAIQEGVPLSDIPIMQDICYLTVMHSLETMKDRGSHLGTVEIDAV